MPFPSLMLSMRPRRLLPCWLLLALLAGCGHTSPNGSGAPDGGSGSAQDAGGTGRGVAAGAPASAGGGGARRPHIVVYMVDTLRADRMGCYGHERDTTPFVDALAGESALFERAIAQAPWTLPSCVSFQTSSFPVNHNVVSGKHRASDEAQTLTEFMHAQGYLTAGFVHNLLGGSMGGLDQGYDVLVERPQTKDMTDEDRARGLHTLRPVFDWLREQDGSRPLYLYIHTVEPHHPYEGTNASREPYMDVAEERKARINKLLGEHRGVMGNQDLATADAETLTSHAALEAELLEQREALWALYDGDVRRANDNVERVVGALRRQGLWDDTVFVFLSDHGEEMYDHGNWFHDQSVFQELVRVPLIVRVPGLTDPGARISAAVQLVDVAPTLADLLGEAPDPRWLGRSLLPRIRAGAGRGSAPPPEPMPVFSQRVNVDRKVATTRGERGNMETAVVLGDLKAILHHDVDRISLYDLAADPGELRDLASERPDDAARLRAEIERFVQAQAKRVYPRRGEVGLTDERLEFLRQLGYIDEEDGG